MDEGDWNNGNWSQHNSWENLNNQDFTPNNIGWGSGGSPNNVDWETHVPQANTVETSHEFQDIITEEEEEQDVNFIQLVLRDLVRYWMPQIPRNNGPLQGEGYMAFLFNGHPEGFKDVLRMQKPIYVRLVDELVARGFLRYGPNARVSAYESFAIFIQTCAMSNHFRQGQDRFQHSNETIHRHFIKVLNALLQFAEIMIVPPDFNVTHARITNDPRFYPYFKDCVGAIDGTHVPAFIRKKYQLPWRNRKKQLSQNVLAICDFDATFTYVCSGWEGSAHDTRVLNYARAKDTRYPHPPDGKFYLVDSGYTNFKGYLSPYRNVKHSSTEFGQQTGSGPVELFNKRHSQLRNVIERAFGILKKRFPILKADMPSYDVKIQVDLVRACCAINNYILKWDPDDPYMIDENNGPMHIPHNLGGDGGTQASQVSMAEMNNFRDQLATQMWNDRTGN